jgi:hypothetical protein
VSLNLAAATGVDAQVRRLLTAAVVAAVVIAGCGGGKPEDGVRDTVTDYFKAMGDGDGERVCSLITPASREQIGGRACPDIIAASAKKLGKDDLNALRDVDVDFTTVAIKADRATVGEGPDDDDPIKLQRIDGKWLVDQTD